MKNNDAENLPENAFLKMGLDKTAQALSLSIDFLYSNQLPYGEFRTFVSPDDEMVEDCQFDSSPFITALAASALRFVDTEKARDMRKKALDFLLGEMEGPGIWRYWSSKNEQHGLIPPDLDDTCCAAFALKEAGVPTPPNESIILSNRNRDGLFYTWLVPRPTFRTSLRYWRVILPEVLALPKRYLFWKRTEASPSDVDGIVNANAVLYLGERKETYAAIQYLIQILADEKEGACDKWHLNKFTYYYMVSRAYFNGVATLGETRTWIVERITQVAEKEGGRIGNVLETALAACSLLNFGEHSSVLDKAIQYLIATQLPNGSWQKFVLYYGGPKRVYGWGSEELTTALCVEALARYQALQ